MSIFALLSASGSPGVTTTAVALATVWPGEALLVELDPKGGDLRLRHGLAAEPGLVTLAASLLGPARAPDLVRHSQTLADGTCVVVGPSSPLEAEAAHRACLADLMGLAHDDQVDVLVDLGRMAPPTAVARLLEHAALVAVVVGQHRLAPHDAAGALEHAAHLVDRLSGDGLNVVAVVVGDSPYRGLDISRELRCEVAAVLPRDRLGVDLIGHVPRTRHERSEMRRSALLRCLPTAAQRVAALAKPAQDSAERKSALEGTAWR